MGLSLVSKTYVADRGERPPTHAPFYPLTPPANLSSSQTFLQGHPFEAYAKIRQEAPVLWHPMSGSEGYWALTNYADIRTANLDSETFSSQKGGILQAYFDESRRHPLLHRAALDTLICLDPPNHVKLRREHMAYFTPNYVKGLKVKVEAKITKLLNNIENAAKDNNGRNSWHPRS